MDQNRDTVLIASKFLGNGVCGVDLAGAEALYKTKDYKEFFEFAKEQNVTYRELRNLNPWIQNSKLTVVSGKTYILKLPVNSAENYKTLLDGCSNPYQKIDGNVETR